MTRARRTTWLAAALLCASSSVASAAVAVGDVAPDWTLAGSDGKAHTLSALRGRHVVIAFFPKAFTGG